MLQSSLVQKAQTPTPQLLLDDDNVDASISYLQKQLELAQRQLQDQLAELEGKTSTKDANLLKNSHQMIEANLSSDNLSSGMNSLLSAAAAQIASSSSSSSGKKEIVPTKLPGLHHSQMQRL